MDESPEQPCRASRSQLPKEAYMRRIAVINQTGGVGKTTIATSLGHALALAGKRVTMVDLDPRGQLAAAYGIFRAPTRGIDRVMLNGTALGSVKIAARDLLTLIPAGSGLQEMARLQEGAEAVHRLQRAVRDQLTDQAFVIFDAPSESGLLIANAIFAADEVLIPVTGELRSLNGAAKTLLLLKRFEPYLPQPLKASIVQNRYLPRDRTTQATQEKLEHHFKHLLLKTRIRDGAAIAGCSGIGRTVFEYKPTSHSAREMRGLADELMSVEAPAA
jgi:chromosome partitioning protein